MIWTLKNEDGDTLAQVLNYMPSLDRNKVLSKLYDGQYMVQTVGEPAKNPTFGILVEDMDMLEVINAAEANCEILTVNYKNRVFMGYIAKEPSWSAKIRGKAYTADIEFAVLSEETA